VFAISLLTQILIADHLKLNSHTIRHLSTFKLLLGLFEMDDDLPL